MIPEGQVVLKKIYPYNDTLYTQGIENIDDNQILISSGRYGYSKVGVYQLNQKSYKNILSFNDDYFAEGLTIVNHCFWLLSFKEELATLYSIDHFQKIKEVSYQGQGWGLAYDQHNGCLWMTNGSNRLQKRDPITFELIETIDIEVQGIPISRINELEYVDGYLYGNIWQTNKIVKLDPNSGKIVTFFDLSAILEELHLDQSHFPNLNFLNGIAHQKDNTFILSGKLYPYMIEVELNKKD